MKRSSYLLIPVYLSLSGTSLPMAAWAQTGDDTLPLASQSADSRIKLLPYDEGDVYTITTKFGYQTNIVFAPGEEIHTISVGDRSLWQLIPSGNRLFIRPMDDGVSTNMTIITNKHSYQFDLKSASGKNSGNIYVAKFVYPDDAPKKPPVDALSAALEPVAAVPAVVAPPVPVHSAPFTPVSEPAIAEPAASTALNYSYSYEGPDELAPLQVYDDGKSTYFKYRNLYQPAPNVYVIHRSGKQQLVTSYRKHGAIAVDAVADELALKSSNGTVHVYNETRTTR